MFAYTRTFNQALENWDVSNVTVISHMFIGAEAFNQVVANWDVSHVTDMSYMFHSADAFNQTLCAWASSWILQPSQKARFLILMVVLRLQIPTCQPNNRAPFATRVRHDAPMGDLTLKLVR